MLHLYMYYFDLDKSSGYETSKSIDMGSVDIDSDARNIFQKVR